MSEFSELRKHEKTQHALAGLGRAALVAACSLTQVKCPNYPKGINKCKKERKKEKILIEELEDTH